MFLNFNPETLFLVSIHKITAKVCTNKKNGRTMASGRLSVQIYRIRVMTMFALVTLTVLAEVLDRVMVPVVPQGTVIRVDALTEVCWLSFPVVADSEPGTTEPPESSAIEIATSLPVSGSTLALYSTK